MHGFDSLTLKNFLNINYDFLKNASVQKVQQPSRREIILNLRNSGVNKKLYVNINPKYPHICFLNETSYALRSLEIPKSPPMFCMQLRKYIEGSRIKEITIPDYERILELHFEVWDEVGQLANLCLSVEIMGKYSNVILYDSRSKNILGSAHNVSAQKSSVREVYGGIPYIYPPKQIKTDILKTSFGAFCEVIKNSENLTKAISSHYYYLSEPIVSSILEVSKSEDDIFSNLQKTVSLFDQKFLNDFWGGMEFNSALDNYFAQIIFKDILNLRKTFLSRILKDEIKKLNSLLKNPPSDEKAFKYKQMGDLIFQYIYLIKDGQDEFKDEYTGTKVPLDVNLNPSQNAQKYYTLYSKAKGAFEYQKTKFDEAKDKKASYDEILFSIENSTTFEQLDEIKEVLEISGLLKASSDKKKEKKVVLEKFEVDGYEIFLGKNSKQNDYLISKIANANDIWLHAYNCPSSHVLIKVKNDQKAPTPNVLEFGANLVKNNSPLKNSGKASVIYTLRKDLKKPPGGVLGYVIYKNEKEIIV